MNKYTAVSLVLLLSAMTVVAYRLNQSSPTVEGHNSTNASFNEYQAVDDLHTTAMGEVAGAVDEVVQVTSKKNAQRKATPSVQGIVGAATAATPELDGLLHKPSSFSTWVWDDISKMNNTQRESIVTIASAKKINRIYLSIDKYLSLSSRYGDASTQVNQYIKVLGEFIQLAKTQGIIVYAEAGDKNWFETSERYRLEKIISFTSFFNRTQEQKFSGVQFDIEPHSLSAYSKNKKAYLQAYVETIGGAASAARLVGLPLSIVVPHFYDCGQTGTPQVEYGQAKTCVFTHLLKILEPVNGSELVVMAYRNFAEGKNGTIDIVNKEFSEASKYKVNVVIAQEMGNYEPLSITFYGMRKDAVLRELEKIVLRFGSNQNFGGLAVHHLKSYVAIE